MLQTFQNHKFNSYTCLCIYNHMHSFRIRMSIYIYIYVLFIMFLIYVLFVVLLFNYCSHFIYSFLMRMAMERDIIYTIRLWHFDSWSWLVSICAFASWVPVAELMKLFFSRDALVMRLGPWTTSTNYGAWHWAHENLQETLVSNMVKKMWKVFFP